MAAPRRRLDKQNSGNTRGEISPIPQIDGLEGEASDITLEEDGSGCTKTDIFNLLKEMQKEMQNSINNFGEKCGSNSEGVAENDELNSIEDDDFEGVKLWALAQKMKN